MANWVVKVGGSLLESPDLVVGLERWCDWLYRRCDTSATPPRLWLLVGGGRAADVVRQWDSIHQLTARASHRFALASMSQTAGLLAELTGWPLVRWPQTPPGAAPVTPPGESLPRSLAGVLAEQDRTGPTGPAPTGGRLSSGFGPPRIVDLAAAAEADPELPESWELTSDSLALWLAGRLGARHVLLLKAVAPLEPSLKIAKISQLGWVDLFFSRMWAVEPGMSVEIAHFHHWPQTTWVDCPAKAASIAQRPG